MPRGISRLDEAQIQSRLWTPRSNIGQQLALWLDAADLSTLTLDASNKVSVWADKSGLGNNCSQATAANRLIYKPTGGTSAGFSGMPSLLFDASVKSFLSGNIALTSTTCFVYVVCTLNNFTNSYGRAVSFGITTAADYNNNSYFNIARDGTNNNVRAERGAATTVYPVTLDSPLIIVANFDGAQQYTEGNGRDMGASAQTAALNTANYKIGQHVGGNESWSGYINEVIVDVAPFSLFRRQHFVGYLAQKWGCAPALYGTHPYRNDPPLIGI